MNAAELKSCPFCSGQAEIAGLKPHLFVRCQCCGCEGPVFQSMPHEAIAAWNRRAPILRDDETHAPTVEAVAAWHDQMAIDAANAPDGEAQSRFHACCAGLLRNDPRAASAIRALIKEGGEDE